MRAHARVMQTFLFYKKIAKDTVSVTAITKQSTSSRLLDRTHHSANIKLKLLLTFPSTEAQNPTSDHFIKFLHLLRAGPQASLKFLLLLRAGPQASLKFLHLLGAGPHASLKFLHLLRAGPQASPPMCKYCP